MKTLEQKIGEVKIYHNPESEKTDSEGFPLPSNTKEKPNVRVSLSYKIEDNEYKFITAGLMATYWDGRKESKNLEEDSARRFIKMYQLYKITLLVITDKMLGNYNLIPN